MDGSRLSNSLTSQQGRTLATSCEAVEAPGAPGEEDLPSDPNLSSALKLLNMDILRAKNPPLVRTELWSCLLAYNLIRLKMLQSCAASGRDPRSLNFTTTLQLLATNWLLCAVIGVSEEAARPTDVG